MYERKILLAFIRLHILYHAAKSGIYGAGMIQELKRHGYSISPGTLYPILHKMTKNGLLKSHNQTINGKIRKIYTATQTGRNLLTDLKQFINELSQEILT